MSNTLFETAKGAEFSDCRTWRYALWRLWDAGQGCVMFVGLNPSTADETKDDPTIRRCIRFAHDWGYGGIYMLNLFAFRATNPKVMKMADDPVGPTNDECLTYYQTRCQRPIVAWGGHGKFMRRDLAVQKHGVLRPPLECLKKTKNGSPGHPLYLPADLKPVPWQMLGG